MKKSTKIIISVLVFAVTIIGVYIVADVSSIRSLSQVIVTETPTYEAKLAGAVIPPYFISGSDDNDNKIIATPDGGWITTSFDYPDNYSAIIKYDAVGNVEWNKKIDEEIYNSVYQYRYFDKDDATIVKAGKRDDTKYARIALAADGGYFVNIVGYEDIIIKIDKDGNKVWQTDYSSWHRIYTYTQSCPYAGNTNDEGQVRYFYTDSSTGQLTPSDWYYDLEEYEYRDADTYYCGQVPNTNYNYSYGDGMIYGTPDGGVVLLTRMSSTSENIFLYSDGQTRNMNHIKQLLFFDKDGKFIDSIDTVEAYQRADQLYQQKYNVSSLGDINDQNVYHDYVGVYPNGDILLIEYPAKAAVKLRRTGFGTYDIVWYTPLGFNGIYLANTSQFYNNGDGELSVVLTDDGGFTIKNQFQTYFTQDVTRIDTYNTPNLQFDLFTYQKEPSYDVDYLHNAMWAFRFTEKTESDGSKQGYLADMTVLSTSWRSDDESNWASNGDITRLF